MNTYTGSNSTDTCYGATSTTTAESLPTGAELETVVWGGIEYVVARYEEIPEYTDEMVRMQLNRHRCQWVLRERANFAIPAAPDTRRAVRRNRTLRCNRKGIGLRMRQ